MKPLYTVTKRIDEEIEVLKEFNTEVEAMNYFNKKLKEDFYYFNINSCEITVNKLIIDEYGYIEEDEILRYQVVYSQGYTDLIKRVKRKRLV